MRWIHYIWISLIFIVPYLIGFTANDPMIYSGMSSTTDGNNYLSLMNQAKEGNLLFTNMYTHEDVPSLNIRPVFMVAGWMSIIMPDIIAYHLMRILGIILFIFYLNKLLSLIFKDKKKRYWTLVITIFASGVGFFFKFITMFGIKQYGSIDLGVAGANNFLTLMGHAHTIFAVAFMIASIYHFLRWFRQPTLREMIYSSIFAFIVGFIHLFDVLTLYLTIALFMIDHFIDKKSLDWKRIKHIILYILITSVPFIYTYIMFTAFPTYAAWNAQNVLTTPKLIQVLFGYGLMFCSFIGYLFYNRKWKVNFKHKYIVYWILSIFILIYSPFNIQRRFLEGAHIPFAIITGIFLFEVLNKVLARYDKRTIALIIGVFILLMLPTNGYHLYQSSVNQYNDRGKFPYQVNHYIYPAEHEALVWLKENGDKDRVVISTYNIGNYIPAYMNMRVYLGHWAQTIDFEKKTDDVKRFYSGEDNINIEKKTYLWVGIDEEGLNPNLDNYRPVYENEKIAIYQEV